MLKGFCIPLIIFSLQEGFTVNSLAKVSCLYDFPLSRSSDNKVFDASLRNSQKGQSSKL